MKENPTRNGYKVILLIELLFFVGNYSKVLDYECAKSHQDFQEFVREDLWEFGKVFIRPFYAAETYFIINKVD